MKILILLSFISFNSYAGFVAGSKVNDCSRSSYSEKSFCESTENEACFEENLGECGIYAIAEILENDTTKPIRNKTQITNCVEGHETDEEGQIINPEIPTCLQAMTTLDCPNEERFINQDQTEAYCSKITGYEQKVIGKQLVIDQALKAQKDQEKAQKLALENALGQAKKLRECGGSVIDVFLVRNAVKNLTVPQVESLTMTFSPIQNLLLNGSLVTAKTKILEVEADGTLVTEQDKTALANAIDNCLGL